LVTEPEPLCSERELPSCVGIYCRSWFPHQRTEEIPEDGPLNPYRHSPGSHPIQVKSGVLTLPSIFKPNSQLEGGGRTGNGFDDLDRR